MSQVSMDVFNPLREAVSRGRFSRIFVRPGWVMGERPEGASRVELTWTQAQHNEAQACVQGLLVLDAQTSVTSLGDTLLLWRAIDAQFRTDSLASEGWMSSLAARTLSAAVGVGRNILVTGPWVLCAHIVTALINEGQRPALLGVNSAAVPAHWACLTDPAQATTYGPDRVGAWSLPAPTLVAAMGQLSGVVGFLDGGRLDRALVRFEAGAEQLPGRSSAPLQVLAGLDLVVVATHQGGPRVREIAEIVLTESGYRPRHVFASGLAPAPTALIPVAVPTFVDELALAGEATLADELSHAAAPVAQPMPTPVPTAAPSEPALPEPRAVRSARSYPPPPVARAVLPTPVESEISHPGWELDRILEEGPMPDAADSLPHVDDAAMAATFGLGPPPRPAGGGARAGKAFSDLMPAEVDEEPEEID